MRWGWVVEKIGRVNTCAYQRSPNFSLSVLASTVASTLYGHIKMQSNRPSHSNTVVGTLAVDGWAVTFGTARRGLGGLGPRPVPSSLYQCNSPLVHHSTASVPTSCHSMWHYNCLWAPKD